MKTRKCKVCGKNKNIDEFKINRQCKEGYTGVCKECINKKRNKKRKVNKHYYIYKFLDIDDNVIYVGQTLDMNKRIYQHKVNSYKNFKLYSNIYKIRYVEVESDYHMNIYEIHYICKYNPTYNTQFKTNNKNLFDLPELIWKPYILKHFIDNCYLSYIFETGDLDLGRKHFNNSAYFKNKCTPEYEKNKKIIDNYFDDINIKYVNSVNEYFNPYIDDDYFDTYDCHFSNEDLGIKENNN